ncbi:MAG: alkaline phosphatase family protein [Proteobacteria bacterium]|nr:alkaline phosphatase family protein [Pseudomonadota bacterium]
MRPARRPRISSTVAWIGLLAAGISAAAPAPIVTATPIRHLVVIIDDSVSFDRYFATYPRAVNPPHEPAFRAVADTPSVNGLSGWLLDHNPNRVNMQNGAGAIGPFRIGRAQAPGGEPEHGYAAEQGAFHAGLMDRFPVALGQYGAGNTRGEPTARSGMVMGYYDGNTVTALWDYAQRFAMSDNFHATTFGPSTVGALNLVSGQTSGVATSTGNPREATVDDGYAGLTVIGNPDPLHDVCARGGKVAMAGRNIGDLLNQARVSWGWFQGGFDLSASNANGSSGCKRSSVSAVTGRAAYDYVPHTEPFQYYPSTANPTHARPSSVAAIGHPGDGANHQYDLEDFYRAVRAGNMPAVAFLKPEAVQSGHPAYSSPLDEQAFLVRVLNFLQDRPEWKDTAVIVTWGDSGGWYDHQMSPIANQSASREDTLSGRSCGDGDSALPGVEARTPHAQGRCGYGPRLPLLVISPWARRNFVDHALTDQTSILRFIEDNWLHGERVGQGSFDALAGTLDNLFDFHAGWQQRAAMRMFLSEATGLPR